MMDDLISRAAAIEAAVDGADDWDGGYNPERERYIKEHMAKVSAVDAIPMWWITEKYLDVLNKDKELSKAVWLVLKAWIAEKKVQDAKV